MNIMDFAGSFLSKFADLGLSKNYSVEEKNHARFTLYFYPAFSVLSFLLVYINFIQNSLSSVFAYAFFWIFASLIVIYQIATKNLGVTALLSSILTFGVATFLFIEGAIADRGYMWFILVPFVIYAQNGVAPGNLWIIVSTVEFILLYFVFKLGYIHLPYTDAGLIEAFFVYIFSTFFAAFRTSQIEEFEKELIKFRLAVENASEHIIITDTDAHVLYANPAASKITGYSNSEIIGKTPALWGKNMPKKFYEHMWKVIKTDKKTFTAEITNKRKTGEIYLAQTSISPVLDSKKKILYFVGIERDITKEKEIDRMKTEFVSLASHQLRTPLAAIKWGLESFFSNTDISGLTEKQKTYLYDIESSNERMINLVNSLLNISRIESGRIYINPILTDIVKLVKDMISKLKIQISNKQIKIKVEASNNLPKINLDYNLISNVFSNLLTNAVIYSPKGGKVIISLSKKDKELFCSVTDSGIGIPDNEKSHIFEKFYRATNAKEIRPDGSGLGLYLIKSIIESSGGKIWFDSSLAKGSTFYFTFPLSGMKAKAGEITIS